MRRLKRFRQPQAAHQPRAGADLHPHPLHLLQPDVLHRPGSLHPPAGLRRKRPVAQASARRRSRHRLIRSVQPASLRPPLARGMNSRRHAGNAPARKAFLMDHLLSLTATPGLEALAAQELRASGPAAALLKTDSPAEEPGGRDLRGRAGRPVPRQPAPAHGQPRAGAPGRVLRRHLPRAAQESLAPAVGTATCAPASR